MTPARTDPAAAKAPAVGPAGPLRRVFPATYHSAAAQEFRDLGGFLQSLPPAGRFAWAASPEEADWILFMEGDPRHGFRALRRHPLLARHFGKCFLFGWLAHRLKPLPGIYTSVSEAEFAAGRCRPVAYPARATPPPNPFFPDAPDERPRRWLFSFVGAATSWTRRRLYRTEFDRADVLVRDTSGYRPWDGQCDADFQRGYVESLLDSAFVLCPRGYGLGTLRLYETLRCGRAPVLLADGLALPEGPRWDEFCLRVPERALAELPARLEPLREHAAEMGRRARRAWEDFFQPAHGAEAALAALERVAGAARRCPARERAAWRWGVPALSALEWARRTARRALRGGSRLAGRPCPFAFQGPP